MDRHTPEDLLPHRYATMPLNGQIAVILMWISVAMGICATMGLAGMPIDHAFELNVTGRPLFRIAVVTLALLNCAQVSLLIVVTVYLTQGFRWARKWAVALSSFGLATQIASWALAVGFEGPASSTAVNGACGGMLFQIFVFGLLVPDNMRHWANRSQRPRAEPNPPTT